MNHYRLMNNQLGYETHQPKTALIRSVGLNETETLDLNKSVFFILDKSENIITSGKLTYLGFTFGIEFWKIDFSDITIGEYKISVNLYTKENAAITLQSEYFSVSEFIYTKNILKNVSIFNAEARIATRVSGGGYNDCNTEMGETFSHGRFLYGMIDYYQHRLNTLSEMDILRLKSQIDRCFNYCMQLWLESGEIGHSIPTRFQADANLGIHNTYWALMGMLYFIQVFPNDHKSSKENINKLILTAKYIENEKQKQENPDIYLHSKDSPSGLMVPVYYHLYKITNDSKFKELATYALKVQCEGFDIFKHVAFMSYITHGLMQMINEFKDHEDIPLWLEFTKKLQGYFALIRDNNAFHIMPSVWEYYAKEEWADMTKPIHVPGEWVYKWFFTTTILHTALDAINVSKLLNDPSMITVASGCIDFTFGTNAGLPVWSVVNPKTLEDYTSAALLPNAPCRHAQAWTEWSFEMKNPKWQSLANGYVHRHKDIFEYDDDWASAETFIASDGVVLTVLCEYEEYINNSQCNIKAASSFNTNIKSIEILEGWWDEAQNGMTLHQTDLPFAALLYNESAHGELSVDITLEQDQEFALMMRGRPIITMGRDAIAGNHVIISTKEKCVKFAYKCQQLRTQLVKEVDIIPGKTYNLKFYANVNELALYLDGEKMLTLTEGVMPYYSPIAGIWLNKGSAVINNLIFNKIK